MPGAGGPSFWTSADPFVEGSAEYVLAYSEAIKKATAEHRRGKAGGRTTPQLVDAFLNSAAFVKLKPRTQSDYRKLGLAFAREFRDDPAGMFEVPESRQEVEAWLRRAYGHSPKQHDYAATVTTRIANWAWKSDRLIRQHHLAGLERLYFCDRREIL